MRLTIYFFAVALLLIVPVFVQDSYVRHLFIMAFVYAVVASNWDLSLGLGGLFNFGHLTFFGTGVYTAAILAKSGGVNPWLAILLAGLAAVVAAMMIALPVSRLKGIYVVLVTFAFSQLALQLVLSQPALTGGSEGLVRIPGLEFGNYNFIRDFRFGYYYVALAMLLVSTAALLFLSRSSFGMALRALRDNPDYAMARGISVTNLRISVLVMSSLFTGIAGGFFAIYLRVAAPEVFSFDTMSLVLSMVLIGGAGTIIGPIVAAIGLTFLIEALAGIQGFEQVRFIVIAVIMILVLRLSPGGVMQTLDRILNRKRRDL